jgi:hypothetical protein
MMLIEFAADDVKMSDWSDRLHRVVGVSEEASLHLATTIYRDVLAWPTSLITVSDVMSYAERYNELPLFLNWIAESHNEPLIEFQVPDVDREFWFFFCSMHRQERLRRISAHPATRSSIAPLVLSGSGM